MITENHLRKMTNIRLKALFNEVHATIGSLAGSHVKIERKLAHFQALKSSIERELATRAP